MSSSPPSSAAVLIGCAGLLGPDTPTDADLDVSARVRRAEVVGGDFLLRLRFRVLLSRSALASPLGRLVFVVIHVAVPAAAVGVGAAAAFALYWLGVLALLASTDRS